MEYIWGFATDIGLRKSVNQDSLLMKKAWSDKGEILLAMVCDGMGGLSQGEVASGTVIESFANWFEIDIPQYLSLHHFQLSDLQKYIDRLLKRENQLLLNYGKENRLNIGTTVTGMILWNNQYLIFHIGDSRIYRIHQNICQLTQDHTWIKQEIDRNHMTEEQARTDPRRNVLLQCVGATLCIHPDFLYGEIQKNDGFLICSDGFRHEITNDEIYQSLKNRTLRTSIEDQLYSLIQLNKSRDEFDNITALYVLCKETKNCG